MQPRELEEKDIITAVEKAAEVTGQHDFVVIGSMALLPHLKGQNNPLGKSVDIDLVPAAGISSSQTKNRFQQALGHDSPFSNENRFYIHHVDPIFISHLPEGWKERATKIPVGESKAFCLSPLDVAFNKLKAGRGKDFVHLEEMVKQNLVQVDSLKEFVCLGRGGPSLEERLQKNIARLEKRIDAPQRLQSLRAEVSSGRLSLPEAVSQAFDCLEVAKENQPKVAPTIREFLRNPAITPTVAVKCVRTTENNQSYKRGNGIGI